MWSWGQQSLKLRVLRALGLDGAEGHVFEVGRMRLAKEGGQDLGLASLRAFVKGSFYVRDLGVVRVPARLLLRDL